jgi:hypothetical protein
LCGNGGWKRRSAAPAACFADVSRNESLRALGVVIALQVAGRLLDLRWHATHTEFEGLAEQMEAHWLIWLGVVATVVVAVKAVIGGQRPRGLAGYSLILASAALYVPVAVWHFIAHANRTDPELAHVLLAIGQVGMLAGALAVFLAASRRPAPAKGG